MAVSIAAIGPLHSHGFPSTEAGPKRTATYVNRSAPGFLEFAHALFEEPAPAFPGMHWFAAGARMKRVAVLISGRGSNLGALIEAGKDRSYPAAIVLVLSNRPDAAGLARARAEGIATAVVDHTRFGKDREAFERALQAELERHRIDIVCLAGFMRLLTPWFVRRWEGRLINIHPALLPAFKGLNTHERALAAGVKVHGATVHFVVPDMDSGPIIAQESLAIRDGDDASSLAARVLELEHRIYPKALKLVASGHIEMVDGECRSDLERDASGELILPKGN